MDFDDVLVPNGDEGLPVFREESFEVLLDERLLAVFPRLAKAQNELGAISVPLLVFRELRPGIEGFVGLAWSLADVLVAFHDFPAKAEKHALENADKTRAATIDDADFLEDGKQIRSVF